MLGVSLTFSFLRTWARGLLFRPKSCSEELLKLKCEFVGRRKLIGLISDLGWSGLKAGGKHIMWKAFRDVVVVAVAVVGLLACCEDYGFLQSIRVD